MKQFLLCVGLLIVFATTFYCNAGDRSVRSRYMEYVQIDYNKKSDYCYVSICCDSIDDELLEYVIRKFKKKGYNDYIIGTTPVWNGKRYKGCYNIDFFKIKERKK